MSRPRGITPFAVLLCLGAMVSLHSCAADRTVRAAASSTVALPRLRVTQLAPIVDGDSFRHEHGAYRYPKDPAPPARLAGAPYRTGEQAVAAAKTWILAHFGPLPAGTSLVAARVSHSASGRDDARHRVTDPGHTIVLNQHYRGTATSIVSVVHVRGGDQVSGRFELAAFDPVAGSMAPVLSAQEAVERVARRVADEGEDEAAVERVRGLAPELRYLYSPLHDEDLDLDPLFFEPNWAFGEWMVDAHTGEIWRNC